MGAFWKVGQWDRENATAQYMEQLQQYAEAYKANKPSAFDYYSYFLSSPDKSLVKDADLLREAIDNGNTITVQLFSPLLDGKGILQTSTESLSDKNGMVHTVGNITNFYCDGGNVTYDNTTLSFKITTTKTKGI